MLTTLQPMSVTALLCFQRLQWLNCFATGFQSASEAIVGGPIEGRANELATLDNNNSNKM